MNDIKCPCHLRNYMEEEDCHKVACDDCCHLLMGDDVDDVDHVKDGEQHEI